MLVSGCWCVCSDVMVIWVLIYDAMGAVYCAVVVISADEESRLLKFLVLKIG